LASAATSCGVGLPPGDAAGRATGKELSDGSPTGGTDSAGIVAGGTGEAGEGELGGVGPTGSPAGIEATPGVGPGRVAGGVPPGTSVVFGVVVVMSEAGGGTTPLTAGDDKGVLLVIRAPASSGKTVGNCVGLGDGSGCVAASDGVVITSGSPESSGVEGGADAGRGCRGDRSAGRVGVTVGRGLGETAGTPGGFASANALIGIFRGSLSPTFKASVIKRIAAIISIAMPPVTA
jgi:hypothetical protein